MIKSHNLFCCFIATVLCTVSGLAQDTELTNKQKRHLRPQYFQTGIGINTGSMRDYATSPLTYNGLLANVSMAYLKMDAAREAKFTTRFNLGNYKYKNAVGVNQRYKSSIYILNLNYYRLYQLNKFSNDKWNFKLGGMFDINTDVRINQDLQNAAFGYEVFNTLSLSGKVTRRLERKEAVTKKILFKKVTFKPMLAFFSFQLNAPIMNNTVRNGFAYIPNEGINTTPLFKEYEAKAFSGIRISSELAYTRQMPNGNMWRAAYIWDAYAAGKTYNRIEIANHIFELSLLFHLNKQQQ